MQDKQPTTTANADDAYSDSVVQQGTPSKPLLVKILVVPAALISLQLYGVATVILYAIAGAMYFALDYASAPQLKTAAVLLAVVMLVLYLVVHVICIGSFYISCKSCFDKFRKSYMVAYCAALALIHALTWVLVLLVYIILLLFVL